MTTASFHDELRAFLASVRRRWAAIVALRASWRVGLGIAAVVAATAATDRAMHPDGAALVLLVGATAALTIVGLVVAFWTMPKRPSDRQVAQFVEERTRSLDAPSFDDRLVSAIDAVERPASELPAFLPLVLEDAVNDIRVVDPSALIVPADIRRQAVYVAASVVCLLAAVSVAFPVFERGIDTARLQFFPSSIHVSVQPGNVRVPIGTPVRIRAMVQLAAGRVTQLAPTLTVFANDQHHAVPMTSAGGSFEYLIESVDRTFSYEINAGSARSARYTVTMLRPPRVARIDLHYVYPAFAGLPPRNEQDGGDIYAPEGTRVHLRIHTDKPVARGELALSKSAHRSLQPAGDRMIEADLVLAKNDSYRIRLTDADGLVSRDEAEYFIRVMDDRPPDVRILRPSADQEITPLEEVPIEARADDDYGIGKFELIYAVAGGPEHVVPFTRVSGTDIQKVGTHVLPAEELRVKPGDVITYYARAKDIGRGKRSTEATSDIFFLEVKPFNEEFMSAESQASGSSDAQIESLIQGQKDIIASTWNVERRSQTARSTDDVKAIAAAQAELKARAEAQLMSRATRSRARPPAPQQVASGTSQPRPTPGDPVATAVGAMGKAVDQLASERTKDALPHEMTALNGLLQLQAEVRRRQVTQGSAGSGFGGNRAGQDLSALFDKELQRQQRTNYETRAAAEIKPDNGESSSALDRIRDLARRQEELNRRQRELAQSNLSAEEMKRQLEKLTREQMDLREQTEELLRRSGSETTRSQGNRQNQGETSGGGQKGSDGLRGAAGDMRSAADDLRRQAPGEAAQKGERALNQLRRLEGQLSADPSGSPSRARSDVKLEAQLIAQEQRRIAGEASRLERSSDGSSADARRRLADEKDRLASRVDEMTRKAEQLSQSASRTDAKAFAEATQSLKRDKIADRMRTGAREMRQAQGQTRGAAEQELAATLDQFASALGSDGSSASSELEQARAIRERLQRAEQQLRDAEARGRAEQGSPSRAGDSSPASGQGRTAGGGGNDKELQRLREGYQRELQRAQDALRRLQGGSNGDLGGATPEQQEFSRSAPGTEAFKQDRSNWESLRRNLDSALEKYEASVSARLARTDSNERFSAGGSDRVPDAYSQLISRYFESLAKKK